MALLLLGVDQLLFGAELFCADSLRSDAELVLFGVGLLQFGGDAGLDPLLCIGGPPWCRL